MPIICIFISTSFVFPKIKCYQLFQLNKWMFNTQYDKLLCSMMSTSPAQYSALFRQLFLMAHIHHSVPKGALSTPRLVVIVYDTVQRCLWLCVLVFQKEAVCMCVCVCVWVCQFETKRVLAALIHKASETSFCHLFLGPSPLWLSASVKRPDSWAGVCHVCACRALCWSALTRLFPLQVSVCWCLMGGLQKTLPGKCTWASTRRTAGEGLSPRRYKSAF